MTVTISDDLIPAVDKIWDVIKSESARQKNPVVMQQLIELVASEFCVKMGNKKQALYVSHHLHRHVDQLIEQMFELKES